MILRPVLPRPRVIHERLEGILGLSDQALERVKGEQTRRRDR